jgi:hypothetical protein
MWQGADWRSDLWAGMAGLIRVIVKMGGRYYGVHVVLLLVLTSAGIGNTE